MTTPRYGSYPQTQFSTGRVQLAQLNFASYVKPLPLIPNLQKFFSVKHFFQSVNQKCQVYNCGLVERERKYSKTRDHSLSLLCLAPLARICNQYCLFTPLKVTWLFSLFCPGRSSTQHCSAHWPLPGPARCWCSKHRCNSLWTARPSPYFSSQPKTSFWNITISSSPGIQGQDGALGSLLWNTFEQASRCALVKICWIN